MKIKKFVLAIGCGAILSGTIVWACDNETVKDAANKCDKDAKICSGVTPVQGSATSIMAWSCGPAKHVESLKLDCKGVSECGSNCQDAQDKSNCARDVQCEDDFTPGNNDHQHHMCKEKNDTQSGDWSKVYEKTSVDC
jgi:hypothetical protein